jgi:predicted transcriptional regulator
MAKSERLLLRVLFPEVRAKLLEALFSVPLKQRYVRELASMTELALHTVQDELRKLTAVGLITTSSNGYRRFYRANSEHPLFAHVTQIVQVSAKLPGTKPSALQRARRTRRGKSRRSRAPRPLPRDLPVRWELFRRRVRT